MLLYFFTPVLTSLRGIQQATTLEKVQKRLGLKKTSLGSLSEASYVFDPELLPPLIKELADQAISQEKDPQLKQIYQSIKAVDGTLLPALPKMLWALWQDDQHRAAKLHLEFDIRKQVPTRATITHGNGNEKKILKTFIAPNTIYLLDCGYAQYKLMGDIIDAQSAFVIRLRDNAVYSILEEKPLTDNDRKAGIQKNLLVTLGCDSKKIAAPISCGLSRCSIKGMKQCVVPHGSQARKPSALRMSTIPSCWQRPCWTCPQKPSPCSSGSDGRSNSSSGGSNQYCPV